MPVSYRCPSLSNNRTFSSTPNRKAVVSPNSSQPFSASSVPMRCQCTCKFRSVCPYLGIAFSELGVSGRRIIRALAAGEADPMQPAKLDDGRLRATKEELKDALSGQPHPMHRQLLSLYLSRLDLIEFQMSVLENCIPEAMKAHLEAVARLVPSRKSVEP
jgi:hypothetical protein